MRNRQVHAKGIKLLLQFAVSSWYMYSVRHVHGIDSSEETSYKSDNFQSNIAPLTFQYAVDPADNLISASRPEGRSQADVQKARDMRRASNPHNQTGKGSVTIQSPTMNHHQRVMQCHATTSHKAGEKNRWTGVKWRGWQISTQPKRCHGASIRESLALGRQPANATCVARLFQPLGGPAADTP